MERELTLHEQTILIAVWRLTDDAYGVAIRENVIKTTGRDLYYGTLYKTLIKLEKRGFLVTRRGEPTPERGGRSKIYYKLTRSGAVALQRTREFQATLWRDVPDLGKEIG